MKSRMQRYAVIGGLAVTAIVLMAEFLPASLGGPSGTAEAVVGAPATPVSYAGVARRSTVGVAAAPVATAAVVAPVATAAVVTPGVGAPVAAAAVVTPGVGAPGVGVAAAPVAAAAVVTPGVGAPGVGVQPANRGGPVNRVGVR